MQPLTHEPIPPNGPGFVAPAGRLLLVAEGCEVADVWLAVLAGACAAVEVWVWLPVVEGGGDFVTDVRWTTAGPMLRPGVPRA